MLTMVTLASSTAALHGTNKLISTPNMLRLRYSKLKSATVFTDQYASNKVKIFGDKRKVDVLPIRTVADLIIADGLLILRQYYLLFPVVFR